MFSWKISLVTAALIAGGLFLAGGAAASMGIQTAMGDDVKLAGYSTAGPYVYLFLTGPNLPRNGVALNDITKRADQGYFTKVSVDGDDHWTFTWHTKSIGGRLDAGTYTVWVVSGPNDRSNLATADYQTISVTLGEPYVSVDTLVPPGGMNLQSVPDGASVTVSGMYRGLTPLNISGLSQGTYTVTFNRPGFAEQSVQVPVQQGRISEVMVTLLSETGTLSVNSTPAGARVNLDGSGAGLSPVVLKDIPAGNHTVVLEKDGYVTAARMVIISAGRVSPVEVLLDPLPAATAATRADGLVPAAAGALGIALIGVAGRRRSHR